MLAEGKKLYIALSGQFGVVIRRGGNKSPFRIFCYNFLRSMMLDSPSQDNIIYRDSCQIATARRTLQIGTAKVLVPARGHSPLAPHCHAVVCSARCPAPLELMSGSSCICASTRLRSISSRRCRQNRRILKISTNCMSISSITSPLQVVSCICSSDWKLLFRIV
jgi:hypothetical protein